ncbi:MAG: ExbD/TolR family protein [Planctomycetota bacterium]|jgi:biopolymer transport protein ExbD
MMNSASHDDVFNGELPAVGQLDSQDSQGPNLAPLLDTIFLVTSVLLVIFVELVPVSGLPISLASQNGAQEEHARTRRVEVYIGAGGSDCRVNGRPVPLTQMPRVVADVSRRQPTDAVYLLAQRDVSYGTVVEVLSSLRRDDLPPVMLGTASLPEWESDDQG